MEMETWRDVLGALPFGLIAVACFAIVALIIVVRITAPRSIQSQSQSGGAGFWIWVQRLSALLGIAASGLQIADWLLRPGGG